MVYLSEGFLFGCGIYGSCNGNVSLGDCSVCKPRCHFQFDSAHTILLSCRLMMRGHNSQYTCDVVKKTRYVCLLRVMLEDMSGTGVRQDYAVGKS